MFTVLTLLMWSLVIKDTTGLSSNIRIGGLFETHDKNQEIAFRYAIDRINMNHTILPKSKLMAKIEDVRARDSFQASKKVCHLLRTGVAAIFGPQSGQTSSHVQSVCDAMEIPHIETRWDFRLRRDDYSVNLYPHPTSLSKAYVDLVNSLSWRTFTIIYEDNDGLIRLQELLKAPSPKEFKITVRQLPPSDDYRLLLKSLKKSGENRIVLDCSTDKIQVILKQAQQVGMMTPYHNYMITSLDLHTLDLEDFKHGDTNITGFRIVDPANPEVERVVADWVRGELRNDRILDVSKDTLRTETALMYDAIQLFAQALDNLNRIQTINTKELKCEDNEAWDHGSSLINYMKMVDSMGLTGLIKFDSQGFRTDFDLDIVELTKKGLTKVGTWNVGYGVNFTRTFRQVHTEIVESLSNKTLIVTTVLSAPYTMYRESSEKLTGNDRFEGFSADLLQEISKLLHFNYTIKLVDDRKYGTRDKKTNRWNGIIGELLDQKADLAIADLTITYEREQAVDFTMPFMNLGISILYKKPTKKAPNLFSFLSPLSLHVWIYMATAYLGVSVLLFILARISPYEWVNPHPCNQDPEELENALSLSNAFWHNIGSLMQQGSDIAPKAVSTRMVAGIWWFFTLIMISSYTANLAAFLTVERMESPIESAEDLAKQTKIKYGSLESGSTTAFFRDSKIPTYQRMWAFMESQRPSVFSKSNSEGVERVQKSDGLYAFLMESASIEYVVERKCDLTQIGGLLDSKGYGIALPPDSPYRTAISSAILQLQEKNVLHILKTRWWKQKKGGGQCKDDASIGSNAANELGLANVGGVFVVLMGGMAIACLIAVCEFVWKSRKLAMEDNVSLCSEMGKELQFALRCRGSTKPVRKAASEQDTSHFLQMANYSQFTPSKYGPSKKEFIT